MTDDERFFERLRGDAASLRYRADAATLAHIRERIHERITRPSVAELLAAWFRPLVAGLAAVVIAGVIALTAIGAEEAPGDYAIEIAGDTYFVVD
jgi:hypothetical protein